MRGDGRAQACRIAFSMPIRVTKSDLCTHIKEELHAINDAFWSVPSNSIPELVLCPSVSQSVCLYLAIRV